MSTYTNYGIPTARRRPVNPGEVPLHDGMTLEAACETAGVPGPTGTLPPGNYRPTSLRGLESKGLLTLNPQPARLRDEPTVAQTIAAGFFIAKDRGFGWQAWCDGVCYAERAWEEMAVAAIREALL